MADLDNTAPNLLTPNTPLDLWLCGATAPWSLAAKATIMISPQAMSLADGDPVADGETQRRAREPARGEIGLQAPAACAAPDGAGKAKADDRRRARANRRRRARASALFPGLF